jgi:hypothetical protein
MNAQHPGVSANLLAKSATLRQILLITTLFMLGIASAGWAAHAGKTSYDEKAVANFYRNKTVRIIVGFTAGGGYDQYSRLIARHLSKYIPGNPNVIVDNMAGAGSIIAANPCIQCRAERRHGRWKCLGADHSGAAVCQSGGSVRHGKISLSRRAGERDLRLYRHAQTRRYKI